MTKLEIRHHYINNLVEMCEGRVNYGSGSPAREAAIRAADAALAGDIKLAGDAWFKALALAGLNEKSTKAQIAALPA